MSNVNVIPFSTTLLVRDSCLCLHAQRAARALARRFDNALKPLGMTNGQFSLLMSLNRPEPPPMGPVAQLLAMDRTTLTAALKPLEKKGLVSIEADPRDKRGKRLRLTDAGMQLLVSAYPIWERVHADIEQGIGSGDPGRLRRDLLDISK
jgi:DNA-binding MarR family transcriptional regulator